MESTTAHPSLTTPKPLAWLYAIGAFIGLIASMTLTVEKFELAEDSSYVPSCTFGESFTCGSVMISEQAAAFAANFQVASGVSSFSRK